MSASKGGWVAFAKHPAVIVGTILLLALFIHPKLLNLHMYFKSNEQPIPMNFVSNFFLWTRHNSHNPDLIIAGGSEKLKETHFKSRKTYLIIHGFTRTGLDDWVVQLKNALLWREDCNVISVDWEAGSVTVGYYVVQARVHLVGEDVSKLLGFLQKAGHLLQSNMHLIGHSLGAHIAGFAGKSFNGTIGRITGLDPAGLSYNGASASDRLDKSDADFVDVIHTHACYTIINHWTDCYGTYDNSGHANFWPNGGEYQPACGESGDGGKGIPEESNCHHGMAYAYYTESIKLYPTSTRFMARKCQSYQLFNNGSCDCEDPPQYMGYNASPKSEGIFYLNTSSISPYGLLEPSCSPAQYSFLKMFGLTVCSLLAALGIFAIYSSVVKKKDSSLTKKDQ